MQSQILMNMILTYLGVIHSITQVTNHAIDKIENRADAFFVLDGSRYGRTIQGAIDDVKTLDSNYVATYYPWIKILDEVKNKPTWVPPSVVLLVFIQTMIELDKSGSHQQV